MLKKNSPTPKKVVKKAVAKPAKIEKKIAAKKVVKAAKKIVITKKAVKPAPKKIVKSITTKPSVPKKAVPVKQVKKAVVKALPKKTVVVKTASTKPAQKVIKPAPIVPKKIVSQPVKASKPVQKEVKKNIPVQPTNLKKTTEKGPHEAPQATPQRIAGGKRRLVVSHKNLSPELQEVMRERFPRGYNDYMDQIIKVDKSDGSFFYAITLEVEDAIYLIKIDVQVDTDYEEVEKKLFGNMPEVDDDGNELPDSDDDDTKKFAADTDAGDDDE